MLKDRDVLDAIKDRNLSILKDIHYSDSTFLVKKQYFFIAACRSKNLPIINFFTMLGYKMDGGTLNEFIMNNEFEIVESLIYSDSLNGTGKEIAFYYGYNNRKLDIIKFLIKNGYNHWYHSFVSEADPAFHIELYENGFDIRDVKNYLDFSEQAREHFERYIKLKNIL